MEPRRCSHKEAALSRFRSLLVPVAAVAILAALPPTPAGAGHRVAARGEAPGPLPKQTVWSARYDGAGLKDVAYGVAVSPDGSRVFVTGYSKGTPFQSSVATIAYDAATGTQLWLSRYPGTGEAITVAPDGSAVYAAGTRVGYQVIAYDPGTGARLWVAQFPAIYSELAGMQLSPDGNTLFVTGDDLNEFHTVAFDAATGHQLWATQYPCAGFEPCVAHGIAVAPDGSLVFVTGDFYSGLSQDDATIAYDAHTGLPVWTSIYQGQGESDDIARSVTVSPDGTRVFVAGTSSSGTGQSGRAPQCCSHTTYVTLAYAAATGQQLWLATYDNQGKGGHAANAVSISPDGVRVYVTGVSWGNGSNDIATIAYDPSDGSQLWVARYDGPAHGRDSGQDVGVAPDGSLVYVTGWSDGVGTDLDYILLAYDSSSGTEAWEVRYDDPGHSTDEALDLAVSPDGTGIFATGGSRGNGSKDDYATIGRVG